MEKTRSFTNTSTKRQWIAEQARRHPERVFTSLNHLIDIDWMREAWRRTRKDGAAGVDGVTAQDYEKDLEANLEDLLNRIKSGRYVAPPVRRQYIEKADGSQRPLGIPTLEDKVAQRAIVMLMEPIYEATFRSSSYGFRPGRSAHDALDAVSEATFRDRLCWVIDCDISKYFDTIRFDHLRGFLDLRIKDGVVRRMLDKWLKAGVLDQGVLTRSETGTPQGGVISPLISNVYLHHVLDEWFETEVKPRMRGRCRLVRYADDAVLIFETERDARRVLDVLGKRLGRYGLTLHPTKTRFVDFRPNRHPSHRGDATFDFLGFTHLWAKSRKGYPVVRRRTAKGRYARAVKSVTDWCRDHRHRPLEDQQVHLARVIRGHCNYYGIRGNSPAIARFRHAVIGIWRRWLSRRHRWGRVTWERMKDILRRHPLPTARVRQPKAAHA